MVYLIENISQNKSDVNYGIMFIGLLDEVHWWEGYSIPENYYNKMVFQWYNDNVKNWKVTKLGEL